jgi:hypothetical protein
VTPAGRIRGASAALVAAYLGAAWIAVPDEARRAELHYAVVATLGYGHLLGALRLQRPARSLRSALRAASTALALANGWLAYSLALARWPGLVLALLAISAWHTVENDLALERACERGHRLGPLSRSAAAQLAAAGATLLVVALAGGALALGELGPALAGSPWLTAGPALAAACAAGAGLALLARGERRRLGLGLAGAGGALLATGAPAGLSFADVFAAATLQHLVSWLLLVAARVRAAARGDLAAARTLARRVAAAHLAPLAVLGLLPLAGAHAEALRGALLAPALYLFVSLLHVAQTARARGLATEPA